MGALNGVQRASDRGTLNGGVGLEWGRKGELFKGSEVVRRASNDRTVMASDTLGLL